MLERRFSRIIVDLGVLGLDFKALSSNTLYTQCTTTLILHICGTRLCTKHKTVAYGVSSDRALRNRYLSGSAAETGMGS